MAAPIRFPFHDNLALRIANLITSDIEALEKKAFGNVTGWQSQFKRPYKAHYANFLSKRAHGNGEAMAKIIEALRPMEAAAQAYMANENRRGRPLTQFVHDANAPDTLPDQKYSKSGRYSQGQPATVENVAQIMAEQARAMAEGNAEDNAIAEALARALEEATGEGPQQLESDADKPPQMGPDGKPIQRFNQSRTPEVKQVPQPKAPPKRESKEDLQRAMEGKADTNIPTMDENHVREIADEQIGEHVPGMVDGRIKALVPNLVAIAVAALVPQRVEVTLPDGTKKDMGVQHAQFPMLLKTLPRFPVWLPGPAGSGKTTAAKNAATALGVPFHHHGAVDNVYQLLGFIDAGGHYHGTSFRAAYEKGGVFLWDEVDASNPAALVAFNAAIENGECVFPDATIAKHPHCYFVAAANTYGTGATHEYVGRTKLDAATLDRFVMLDWNYDERLERVIAGDTEWTTYVQRIRKACKDAGIKHLVTPRASIRGNDLLAQGIDAATVVNMTIRKGLADDQWNNVKNRVPDYRHVAGARAA